MAVPTTMTDLSVTAESNSPAGADTVTATTGPDEFFRSLCAILRREQAQGANVASAATVDLGAIADGAYVHVTGTTTITAFGTVAAGIERTVVFDGALTLTHNATSLILVGGANITTAAGDVAVFRSEGSGNWRQTAWAPAVGIATRGTNTFTGTQINTAMVQADQAGTVTAAANLSLAPTMGNYIPVSHASGTVAITSLGGSTTIQAGTEVEIPFTVSGGTLTMTHNATSLQLGGADITVLDGMVMRFRKISDANAYWKLLGGIKADGTPILTASVAQGARIQVFTASGTYTKPAGLSHVIVTGKGASGGGGGGGDPAYYSRGGGGGGGGGGGASKRIPAASIGATEAVTIGAGGTAGAVGTGGGNGSNGGNGGTSSFGSHLSIAGGTGGTGGQTTSSGTANGGAGGAGAAAPSNTFPFASGATGGNGGNATNGAGTAGTAGATVLAGGAGGAGGVAGSAGVAGEIYVEEFF